MVKPRPERCFCTLLRIAKLAQGAVERGLQARLQPWSVFRSASITKSRKSCEYASATSCWPRPANGLNQNLADSGIPLRFDPSAGRLSYDFSRREGEKEALGEGGCPLVSGEGRIGNTLTV